YCAVRFYLAALFPNEASILSWIACLPKSALEPSQEDDLHLVETSSQGSWSFLVLSGARSKLEPWISDIQSRGGSWALVPDAAGKLREAHLSLSPRSLGETLICLYSENPLELIGKAALALELGLDIFELRFWRGHPKASASLWLTGARDSIRSLQMGDPILVTPSLRLHLTGSDQ
ncbi:MAG: hypothetical protein WCH11_00375, partial [Bdellovibrio sp.]